MCASKNLEGTAKLSKKLSQLYLYTYGKKEYLSFTLPTTKKLSGPWFYTRHGSFVLSPGTDQLLFFPWPQVSEWCFWASLLLLFQNRQLRFHLSLVTSNTNKCQSLWELNNTQNTTYFWIWQKLAKSWELRIWTDKLWSQKSNFQCLKQSSQEFISRII